MGVFGKQIVAGDGARIPISPKGESMNILCDFGITSAGISECFTPRQKLRGPPDFSSFQELYSQAVCLTRD